MPRKKAQPKLHKIFFPFDVLLDYDPPERGGRNTRSTLFLRQGDLVSRPLFARQDEVIPLAKELGLEVRQKVVKTRPVPKPGAVRQRKPVTGYEVAPSDGTDAKTFMLAEGADAYEKAKAFGREHCGTVRKIYS